MAESRGQSASRDDVATDEDPTLESNPSAPREGASALDRVLSLVSEESPAAAAVNSVSAASVTGRPLEAIGAGLRAVRLLEIEGAQVIVESLDGNSRFTARCAPFVDVEFATDALKEGQLALVEIGASGALLVGFVQTQRSRATQISSATVEIEGKEELVLRSGRAALRLRADGTVELVGTRISALSRGVLKLVGRALRLN